MNCNIKKCKSICCGPVPIDKIVYQQTESLRQIKVIGEREIQDPLGNDYIIPFTEKLVCPYLNKDYRCEIYDIRPEVCKLFGNGKHKYLTCKFLKYPLDKN